MQFRRCVFSWMLLAVMVEAPASADSTHLARQIDLRLADRFAKEQIQPAPLADDAEFLRRAYLDLTGRIPRPSDVHRFLADASTDKRPRLIDRLLADPRFSIHFANVWRAELLPELTANRGAEIFQTGFEAWLRDRLRSGVGYDQVVRELLSVPLPSSEKEAEPVLRDPDRPNALAFFAVKEARPENLAAAVTRTFLGIQLECAQCHDHPFAKWKQDQFWAQAAFFAGIERQNQSVFSPLLETVSRRVVTPPNGKKSQQAVFLDGRDPVWKADRSSREALAEWITSRQNPFFARATVNRIWGKLFGVGLVEPVDDFRDDNPVSDSDLLDDLANSFVQSGFDLKHVIRAICLSQAYQRSSALTHPSQKETRLPAHMTVKAMTGEQLFDSLALATGYQEIQDKGASRRQFLTRFSLSGPISEPETSVQQVLTLRNGTFVAWATDPTKGPTLIAACKTPGMTQRERIEVLYLATLSRKPTEREHARFERFFSMKQEQAESLADVFWMLLNSAEFRLNH